MPPDRSFGPFEILDTLGEGGGGIVYRARDPRLERDVALKLLHYHSENQPDRLLRFLAEARAASALNHPNIVTVFDAALDGDRPFIVSELVDGRTLREELRRGTVPLKRLLDFATQIADGLAAAHDAGIVHRDLKPENILVTRAGRIKIVDFGLARPGGFQASTDTAPGDDSRTQTELGLRAGTVPYMSPEQARGVETDFRSDQFSFGLIVFEMAAGRSAFRRDSPAATLDAIINDEPPWSALDARIPTPLRWILERCLAKDPSDRYGNTADLHRDLRTLHNRLGELGHDAGGRLAAVSKRRRRATLAALGLCLLALMATAGWLLLQPQRQDPSELRFAPLAWAARYEGFPAWSPRKPATIAYVADVDGTLQIFTRRLSDSSPTQVTRGRFDKKDPFWSPDGLRLYYVSRAGLGEGIWSIDAAGGDERSEVLNAAQGAISRDGTLAFFRNEQPTDVVGASTLWLARSSAAPARYTEPPFDAFRFVEGALSISPDGRTLGVSAVVRSDVVGPGDRGWQFWVIPLTGGKPQRRFRSLSDVKPRVNGFTWIDDRYVVLSVTSLTTPGSHLWMGDTDQDEVWPLTVGAGSEAYPSASPDGLQVAFAIGEPDYDLVEIELTDHVRGDLDTARPLLATARNESDPVWSRTGELAYVTDGNGHDEIWLKTHDGTDRELVAEKNIRDESTIMLSSPAFSPDGRLIAYQRNEPAPIHPLRIWVSHTDQGPAFPLAPEREGYQGAPTWSRDGEWIAFSEWQIGRPALLVKKRVNGKKDEVVLRGNGVPNAAVEWSPTDQWITWETDEGLTLVSPDGRKELPLTAEHWLAHAWSRDGTRIYAIRETEALRLQLIAIHIGSGGIEDASIVKDLGPSPPVNNPIKGLSVRGDGRGVSVVTSMARIRSGDLWTLSNLRRPVPRWRLMVGSR